MNKQTATSQTEKNERMKFLLEVHSSEWFWLNFLRTNNHMTLFGHSGYWY